MTKKITIAIDGFSSTGKSTLAKQLAKHFGYIYVDTGAMYRAVAFFAMQNNLISSDSFNKVELVNQLKDIMLEFKFNSDLGFAEMYLNGDNVEKAIRTIEVSGFVSKVAEVSEVRAKLVEQQQEMGKNKAIVMDGRDIGTVVFPDAELKVFMTASASTRAQRRYDELLQKGDVVTYEEVLKNVEERDYIDTHREDSPLVMASDAVEIDNSYLNREEQFEAVLPSIRVGQAEGEDRIATGIDRVGLEVVWGPPQEDGVLARLLRRVDIGEERHAVAHGDSHLALGVIGLEPAGVVGLRPGPGQLPRRGATRLQDRRAVARGDAQHVPGRAHGQGPRHRALPAPGQGDRRFGRAQPRRPGQPGAPENQRRLHLHALGGGVCADGVAGPPAQAERGPGPRSRYGRSGARHGQGPDAPRGAQQARRPHARRVRHHEEPPRGGLQAPQGRGRCGGRGAGRVPAPP